jgi:hypothetical protein
MDGLKTQLYRNEETFIAQARYKKGFNIVRTLSAILIMLVFAAPLHTQRVQAPQRSTIANGLALRGAGIQKATANPVIPPSNRKLDITFLFHANQNLVPYGKVADRVCFRGLLTTLRRHPKEKFMIHFSGTLIHDLLWFGDSTLQILRQGIQDGQFEIIGSTYNQNVMYSTRSDTNDFEFNDHQIKIHKEEIQNVFGTEPAGFWNPERVWTQNFTQLLADNGYKYVQVEDHILQASGATGPLYQMRTTGYNGRQVTVFEDDKEFLGLVDNAVNSRNASGVISYLNQKYAEDTTDADVIGYYQDAEATGLWQYEQHIDPQLVFAGLDTLLSAIERDTLINVTTCGTYMQTHPATEYLPRIVDGAAEWMGGDAWFAENLRPEFATMRVLYDSLRTTLDSVAGVVAASPVNPAAQALLQHAWFTLCAHQFEFGCHGVEGELYQSQLQLARTCLVSAEAALFALNPTTTSFIADLNRDGVNEAVLVTPQNFFVFSSSGGRLLYWFDLVRGEEMIGDEDFSADYLESYVDDNLALPLIRGGIETYPWLSGNPVIPEVLTWTFNVRKRALNDILTVGNGSEQSLANTSYSVSLNGTIVSFSTSTGGVSIRKDIEAGDHRLNITYHLKSDLASSATITHRIENAFSPSYLAVINGGRKSLEYWNGISGSSQNPTSSTVGVRNSVTDNFVRFAWTDAPDQLVGAEDVFALELNPVYWLTLNPGDSVSYAFSLLANNVVKGVSSDSSKQPAAYNLGQNYPNPFNPSTNFRFTIAGVQFVSLKVFDLLGREVVAVVNEVRQPGDYVETWDASNVPSGVYFYRLDATSVADPTKQFTQTRKMLLVK